MTISYRAVIDNPLPAGVTQIRNQGIVSGSNIPNIPSDGPTPPGGPTDTPVTSAPKIIASKIDRLFADADNNGVPSPGDTLLYQVTIQNIGNAAATGMKFTDVPDPNTRLVVGSVQTSQGFGEELIYIVAAVIGGCLLTGGYGSVIGASIGALIFGMTMLTIGLLYFTQVSVGGSYWADLFPGFLVLGVAIPFAFVPITIAALAGTKPHEAGLASGLINTSQQIGGAVGIAVLSTIAVTKTSDELASGTQAPIALTDGFVNAFWAGAAIAFVGVLVSIFLVRGRDVRPHEAPVGEPALEGASG